MANNYKHTRTVSNTIKVKGYVTRSLDEEAFIEYETNGDTNTVSISELFDQFIGEEVNVSISTKEETDLSEWVRL